MITEQPETKRGQMLEALLKVIKYGQEQGFSIEEVRPMSYFYGATKPMPAERIFGVFINPWKKHGHRLNNFIIDLRKK